MLEPNDVAFRATSGWRWSFAVLIALAGTSVGCGDDTMPMVDGGPMSDGAMVDSGPDVDGGQDAGPPRAPDGLYTLSNDATANAVMVYSRAADGSLTEVGSVETGGAGSGAGLGSQNGLFFEASRSRFFAVNAGDNTIAMLDLASDGTLTLASTVDSGGVSPRSIAAFGDLVYVANAGDADAATPANIAGFRVSGGALAAIADSSRPLSVDNPGPGQIQFNSDGSVLVVTEKGTSKIDTFTVDADGVATGPIVHPSAGMTPFGFAMTADDVLVVSEAFGGMDNMGASSSYSLGEGTSGLGTVSASVPNSQSAPCWVAVTDGHAYVTNTRSNSVTGYDLEADGTFVLGWSAPTGAGPLDAVVTDSGAFLYVLNGGDDSFSIYGVNASTGTLSAQPAYTGLPAASAGLAVGPSAIYTMSNAAAGNEILGFLRAVDGSLSPLAPVATGGHGSDGGLGSQGAVVVDSAAGRLLAVNAGDDTISLMTIGSGGALTLRSTVASGGVSPVSITVDGDIVYVANKGDDATPANIAGFRIMANALVPIAGSSRPLSADAPAPAQIRARRRRCASRGDRESHEPHRHVRNGRRPRERPGRPPVRGHDPVRLRRHAVGTPVRLGGLRRHGRHGRGEHLCVRKRRHPHRDLGLRRERPVRPVLGGSRRALRLRDQHEERQPDRVRHGHGRDAVGLVERFDGHGADRCERVGGRRVPLRAQRWQ